MEYDKKEKLLGVIKSIRRDRLDDDLKDVKRELSKVKRWKKKALNRMESQQKAGDTRGAELSQRACEYASQYESQLSHIIEGYEMQKKGTHYFTKDGDHSRRFIKHHE